MHALLLLIALPALAEQTPKNAAGFIEENDKFAVGGGDSYYTQGMKLFYLHRDDRGWVKKLEPWWFRPASEATYYWGAAAGQNMYTPRDISIPDPILDDRPYAGWLYAGFILQRHQKEVLDTLELDLGVIGPDSRAEQAQRFVHRVIRVGQPQGWGTNQLGTQWSGNLSYQRRWRTGRVDAFRKIPFDIIPHGGFAVGNVQDFLNIGNTVRMGLWRLPEDFGADYIMTPSASGAAPRFGAYFFARVDGRLTVHDAFLDRRRPGGFPKAERESFVADGAVGMAISLYRLRLAWSQLWRTPEFKTQVRAHHYASISGSYSF